MRHRATTLAIVAALSFAASCGRAADLIGGMPDASGEGGDCCSLEPPSCASGGPGLMNCGAARESCCTSLAVTGGTYYRTYDSVGLAADGGYGYTATLAADGGPIGEADPATVSSFRLDKYAVTVGRFRQFVAAWNGGWTPAAASGKHTHLNGGLGLANSGGGGGFEPGWVAADDGNISPTDANLACAPMFATWTSAAGSQENLPIDCLNWYESYAFCIWDGGFLPSEAEWEYAAAGGSQQREYPWGTADPGSANQYAIYGDGQGGCYWPTGTLAPCTGVSNAAPVGTATLGAGLWGQLDLTGNMWQWNVDEYAPYAGPCVDCADLTAATFRVVRGGTFNYYASYLLSPSRNFNAPSDRYGVMGMRCARIP